MGPQIDSPKENPITKDGPRQEIQADKIISLQKQQHDSDLQENDPSEISIEPTKGPRGPFSQKARKS